MCNDCLLSCLKDTTVIELDLQRRVVHVGQDTIVRVDQKNLLL